MGKTLLCRVPLKPARFGTIDVEDLHVNFGRVHKPTGRKIGGVFTEVTQVGWDRSKVDVRWGDRMRRANGLRGLSPGNDHFRLLDRHDHVRELAPTDADVLAVIDAEIEELEAQLRQVRETRAAAVKSAWRRAGKLSIGELEELAESKAVMADG